MSDDPRRPAEEDDEPVPINGLARRSRAFAAWVFMFLIAFVVVWYTVADDSHGFPDSVLLTLTGALLLMLGIQSGISFWRK